MFNYIRSRIRKQVFERETQKKNLKNQIKLGLQIFFSHKTAQSQHKIHGNLTTVFIIKTTKYLIQQLLSLLFIFVVPCIMLYSSQ